MRIAFTTLGCKINQYETDVIRQDLHSKGNTIVPFDAEADVYIINTCSVTAKSDHQCKQIIRSTVRRGKGAKVVVTGCFAETSPKEIEAIPGVGLVIGNRDKDLLPNRIMETVLNSGNDIPNNESECAAGQAPKGRTRGVLKIQDGCNNRCSYCIVPIARGKSRSVELSRVIAEFEQLVRSGCPEVVLSGIHIGTYGMDLQPASSITELISNLISKRNRMRLRLSSIEPNEITEEIIAFLGTGLCRHLHIPLQSGDDGILKAMKRHYTSGDYLELLYTIADQVQGIALGADIMVGFPGEGDTEFQNTMNLVKSAPLTHLHVFSYSPRPGTLAAEMKPQVSEKVKKERSKALRELGMRKNLDFRRKCLASVVKTVIEDKQDADSGFLTGLTDNYIRVIVSGAKKSHIGKEINVRLEKAEKERNIGSIL